MMFPSTSDVRYCKKRKIVDDHGNLRCERNDCVYYNMYFLVKIYFVEAATGSCMWLTLFDQCIASLLDVNSITFLLWMTLYRPTN